MCNRETIGQQQEQKVNRPDAQTPMRCDWLKLFGDHSEWQPFRTWWKSGRQERRVGRDWQRADYYYLRYFKQFCAAHHSIKSNRCQGKWTNAYVPQLVQSLAHLFPSATLPSQKCKRCTTAIAKKRKCSNHSIKFIVVDKHVKHPVGEQNEPSFHNNHKKRRQVKTMEEAERKIMQTLAFRHHYQHHHYRFLRSFFL